MKMAAFARDKIELKVLLRTKPPVLKPTEPTYRIEITGETELQKRRKTSEIKKNESLGKIT